MKEKGKIVELKNGVLTVKTEPQEDCAKCCKCGAARPRTIYVKQDQYKDIEVGDTVEVEVTSTGIMKVYILLYAVPLLVFACSVILFYAAFKSPLVSFLISLVLTSLAFFVSGHFIKRDASLFPTICKKENN